MTPARRPTPDLKLTANQVEHALWHPRVGRPKKPTPAFRAQLNYLRRSGVPFDVREGAPGSGTSLVYDFYHLAELSIAWEMISHGAKPALVAKAISIARPRLRRMCAEAYARGEEIFGEGSEESPYMSSFFLYFQVYEESGKKLMRGPKLLSPHQAIDTLFTMGRAVYSRNFIALSKLLERSVERALEVPAVKRGRPPKRVRSKRKSGAAR